MLLAGTTARSSALDLSAYRGNFSIVYDPEGQVAAAYKIAGILADSDIYVALDYLGNVVSPLPLRDLLSLGLWGLSFITRRVRWRDSQLDVARDGSARLVEST